MLQRFSHAHRVVMTLAIHVAGIDKDMLCSKVFWIVRELYGANGCTHKLRNRLCLGTFKDINDSAMITAGTSCQYSGMHVRNPFDLGHSKNPNSFHGLRGEG
jgi:hypothetical protein